MTKIKILFALSFIFQAFLFAQTAEEQYEKGELMFELGKFDEASKFYSEAIKLKPDYEEAYYMRGKVFDVKMKYDEALKDYNKALELKPGDVGVLNDRGTLFFKTKKYSDGMLDYNKVLEIDPKNADAYYFKGSAYVFFLSLPDSAILNLDKAIEYNPKFKIALNLRATVYLMKMEFDKAFNDANTAISIDPDYPSAYVTRGGVYYVQNKCKEALSDFEKVKTLAPGLFEINKNLKKMYEDCKNNLK